MKVIKRDPSKGYLDTNFWVPKAFCNVEGVKNSLTFQFVEKNAIKILTLWKETPSHLIVPREFWDTAGSDITFPIIDCRPSTYTRVDIHSHIKLDHRPDEKGVLQPTGKDIQRCAMEALLRERGGILQLACGLGKTVVALDYASRLQVPTLIVVNTTQLALQWREEIERHLTIPDGIGLIGDGEFIWNKPIVLATYHTLANRAMDLPEEVRRWFGLIVWDEAHHLSAPKFCRSADLFFGRRILLTATPDRTDGYQIVYNFHAGKVIYKNLTQDLKPRIYFQWTGLQLNPRDPYVQAATKDKNGELHIGKVAGYFGRWKERLLFLLNLVKTAVQEGRKVLVLSKSVDEVVNLLAIWNGRPDLYTDIPFPSASEVGERAIPMEADAEELKKTKHSLHLIYASLKDPALNPIRHQHLNEKKRLLEHRLEQHRVHKKCESLYLKRQKTYREQLLAMPSNAGIMIYKVDAEKRTEMLRRNQVTFAINSYGREGLDERSLDTVIVSEPLSDRNSLQQLMGRVLREKHGKKEPVVMFLEDDIGLFIGMCQQLRKHLKTWPIDEGGPFEYELLNNPRVTAPKRQPEWATGTSSKKACGY